jgi:hypothetical protein
MIIRTKTNIVLASTSYQWNPQVKLSFGLIQIFDLEVMMGNVLPKPI